MLLKSPGAFNGVALFCLPSHFTVTYDRIHRYKHIMVILASRYYHLRCFLHNAMAYKANQCIIS